MSLDLPGRETSLLPFRGLMGNNFEMRSKLSPIVDLTVDNNSRFPVILDSDILWAGCRSKTSLCICAL